MAKVYYLKNVYFNELLKDTEFIYNPNRPYYVVRNLIYKNKPICVAIPLRSNINKKFQKNKEEFIPTPPTSHTLTGKGNIAGWHFTKMVPINFENTISVNINDPDIAAAVSIANDYKKDEFIEKVKKMLLRLEKGQVVFGAINFDKAIEVLEQI